MLSKIGKITTNLMKNLGYKKEMINKKVEIILSQGMEKKYHKIF